MYLINLCMYATYSMCVTLLSITCSLITDMILMNYINNLFKVILSLLYFPGYFNYKVHLHTTLQLFMYRHKETGSRLSPNMIIPTYIVNLRYIQITGYTLVPNPCDGYYIYVCFCSIQLDNNSSTK